MPRGDHIPAWAFFHHDGYLGTVTEDGDVVFEDECLEEEYR